MSAIWKNHGARLAEFINNNNETQAHMYLEQLMLFPVDVQDKIIDEVSKLSYCSSEAVAEIIGRYTIFDLH